MEQINIITASFGAMRKTSTAAISYQYDVVQFLKIEGVTLPQFYEVDMCNDGDARTITMVGGESGVQIPDQLLLAGKPVKAYIVLTEDTSVQTRYEITIPVNKRPARSDIQPTPAEQQQIDALIEALNDGVDAANEAADEAAESADASSAFAAAALASEQSAQASAIEADQAASSASESASDASGYAERAEQAANAAAVSESNAATSEQNAAESASDAYESAERAEQAAATAGYLDVEIVDGNLIYTRTDAVDVDFALDDGHLIMEAI